MKILAFLYDTARNMRGDPDFYENLLNRISHYGYNMFCLNLEYRFNFPSHPEVAPEGSLDPDDIRKLDLKAKALNIELVPFANCACHTEGFLALEKFRYLGMNLKGRNEQLKVGIEESYTLITELYDDLFKCFSSKYFHIGADEIRWLHKEFPDLTDGQRWNKATDFVLKICAYVQKHGKTVMLSGDMWANHPENRQSVKRMPEGIIICDRHYYGVRKFEPAKTIEAHNFFKSTGIRFLATTSVNGYYSAPPILSQNTEDNIVEFTRLNNELDGDGVFLTSWEYSKGGIFSAHWPFIYLQSRVFIDNRYDNNFYREYTAAEWGIDNDLLEQWYQYIDKDTQAYFEPLYESYGQITTQACIRMLRTELLARPNIFKGLDNIIWLCEEHINALTESAGKALLIAEKMSALAVQRKEESEALLEWSKTYLAILKICSLYLSLKLTYHEAAVYQFKDEASFNKYLNKCLDILNEMKKNMNILCKWEDRQIKLDNHAPSENWYIKTALKDLQNRYDKLRKAKFTCKALELFENFVAHPTDFTGRLF